MIAQRYRPHVILVRHLAGLAENVAGNELPKTLVELRHHRCRTILGAVSNFTSTFEGILATVCHLAAGAPTSL